MRFRGRVHKYGADINTDVIIPARYLNMFTPEELAPHCLEDLDPEFARRVRAGDILMGTTNLGCGSSREHAPLAIKGAGVSCVIAKTFARIFFRNCINLGLPAVESPEAVEGTDSGDELEVDLSSGTIRNLTKGREFRIRPYDAFMMEIIQCGGLLEYTKRRLAERGG